MNGDVTDKHADREHEGDNYWDVCRYLPRRPPQHHPHHQPHQHHEHGPGIGHPLHRRSHASPREAARHEPLHEERGPMGEHAPEGNGRHAAHHGDADRSGPRGPEAERAEVDGTKEGDAPPTWNERREEKPSGHGDIDNLGTLKSGAPVHGSKIGSAWEQDVYETRANDTEPSGWPGDSPPRRIRSMPCEARHQGQRNIEANKNGAEEVLKQPRKASPATPCTGVDAERHGRRDDKLHTDAHYLHIGDERGRRCLHEQNSQDLQVSQSVRSRKRQVADHGSQGLEKVGGAAAMLPRAAVSLVSLPGATAVGDNQLGLHNAPAAADHGERAPEGAVCGVAGRVSHHHRDLRHCGRHRLRSIAQAANVSPPRGDPYDSMAAHPELRAASSERSHRSHDEEYCDHGRLRRTTQRAEHEFSGLQFGDALHGRGVRDRVLMPLGLSGGDAHRSPQLRHQPGLAGLAAPVQLSGTATLVDSLPSRPSGHNQHGDRDSPRARAEVGR